MINFVYLSFTDNEDEVEETVAVEGKIRMIFFFHLFFLSSFYLVLIKM